VPPNNVTAALHLQVDNQALKQRLHAHAMNARLQAMISSSSEGGMMRAAGRSSKEFFFPAPSSPGGFGKGRMQGV